MSGTGVKAAFSSNLLTPDPPWSTTPAISWSIGGGPAFRPKDSGSKPIAQGGKGGGGTRLKSTRKYFALTRGNEIVCSGAPPSGSFVTARKVWPSSLASRDLSGFETPVTTVVSTSTSFVTMVRERISCVFGNSY